MERDTKKESCGRVKKVLDRIYSHMLKFDLVSSKIGIISTKEEFQITTNRQAMQSSNYKRWIIQPEKYLKPKYAVKYKDKKIHN